MNSLFPSNPKHGMIFELRDGFFFKYDATVRSWIKITSNSVVLTLASPLDDGAMAAVDLKKLNRLVLSLPVSSIIGTDCTNPFQSGNIGMFSGDKFVHVDGNVKVGNIGSRGELLSRALPFKIHQHTYGLDFTIDLPNLVEELKFRNQFNNIGKKGAKGIKGDEGEPGPDHILAGPPGDPGPDGLAPDCGLSVEEDTLAAEPIEGMTKAIVHATVVPDPDDSTKYKLVFDRQLVGPVGYAAEQFHVQDEQSPWTLVIVGDSNIVNGQAPVECSDQPPTAGKPQPIFYIDIEPIIEAIRDRFLDEVRILRTGYQNIVKFWIQTMADLFDEQKSVLCCALEHCMSITKNQDSRRHMESVAGAAAGSANVLLHGRDSNEASVLSSTRTLKQIGGQDSCRGGPRFPHYPNMATGGEGGFGGTTTPASNPTGAAQKSSLGEKHITLEGAITEGLFVIDPLVNSSAKTGIQALLQPGDYTAIIHLADAQIDGKHRADVKIQHFNKGSRRSVQFLDKGQFDSLIDAKSAYEGLSLSFHHEGGLVSLWLPMMPSQVSAGTIEVIVRPAQASPPQEKIAPEPTPTPILQAEPETVNAEPIDMCGMTISHLAWYQQGWETGNCCGLVMNIMGQDYIIVKRSIGIDMNCGGGEAVTTPCIAKFLKTKGHSAFAWPTFDGKKFAPLPRGEMINFRYDAKLNEIVAAKIADGDFETGKGNPPGVRHLTHQLATVLFPAS
jgi:hypothetical protein